MPVPIDHPILNRINRLLIGVNRLLSEPMIEDIVRKSKSVAFTDDIGNWEIVVRRIEGG